MAPRCSCRSGCSPCSLRRNDDTAKFSHVNYSGTIVDRVERSMYHTWDALIDAVAEKALIAGGGHHGYRRCFAVRGSTTCTRARRFRICFSQGLPKWARDPRADSQSWLLACLQWQSNPNRQIGSRQSEKTFWLGRAGTPFFNLAHNLGRPDSVPGRRCLPSPWVSAP